MHIKKLEISGFKSFVDRTVIHFDHDVVGIVGPNGCGKSNIVDAIRWCMGEQSARHLRGRSMADVIFAGSQSRGPHGMAEVTLTFDNSDPEAAATLPLEYRDYAEIAVTRRLYRDGTSEYLVNKTQVRLKDITDLFLGTGVGTKAYSIIEQGKIGLIVSARAEDRRLIIEEAAGITKYKARRKQAEQKIDLTKQNLLRVGDIVSEIERNLASLKRQAAKAERYVSYKKELEDLVLCESSQRLLELIVRSQVEEFARAEATEQHTERRAALDAREAELEVTRMSALEVEDATERAHSEAFKATNEVRIHEGEIERARDRYASVEERRKVATAEADELNERLVTLSSERSVLSQALESAATEEAASEEAMRIEAERLDDVRTEQQAADLRANELRKAASEAQAQVAAAEATLRGFEHRCADMQARRERLEDEDGRLMLEAEDLSTKKTELATRATDLAERRVGAAARRDELNDALRTERERAVELDRHVDRDKGELAKHRGRLRALEELHARREGVGQGPRTLVGTKDPTVVGLVADRFEAPAELTHAFAAALAGKIDWVVVDDLGRGLELVAELAKTNKGRASVIARRPRYVAGRFADAPAGTLLVDRVAFEAEDEPLAHALFGDVLLALDDASAVAALAGGWPGRVVTLSGTLFGEDGSVTGGAGDALAEGMIEHKREMRELHDIVSSMDDGVTALLEQQSDLRARLSELGTALDRSRAEAHELEIAVVTAEKDLRRTEEQLSAVERRLVSVRSETTELAERLAEAGGERDRAIATLDDGRARQTELEEQRGQADETAEEWRERVMMQSSALTERKVVFAQVRERTTSIRQTVDRLEKSCAEMQTRVTRLDQEIVDCATQAGVAAAKLFVERELLSMALVVAKGAEDTLTEHRVRLEEVRGRLSESELELKELRTLTQRAGDEARTRESNLEKLGIERRHLEDGVRERFRGLELATVVGDYHKRPPVDAAHRARIGELGELLERMGPVNLDAVREHAEAEERYTYYSGQKEDLERAIADLEQAIMQMNRDCKRLFKEAYDGINARFKALFPKMFRGGQAELRMTNPEDLLETGIEILAQPPGKKLASIDLMSGGEKALTAVSLIFAVFQFKPSPFCILDEVDAPLDEANVTRYNEGIRSMTDRSQFILITHIKRTMQSVDVLYGVTMQEPGVSKLVSVKVNEAAAARSTQVASAPPAAAVA
jgi:chromosome segregation protein